MPSKGMEGTMMKYPGNRNEAQERDYLGWAGRSVTRRKQHRPGMIHVYGALLVAMLVVW